MAEAIGVVASGIAIGSLANGITSSVVKLKSYWDQVQDAPEDIQDLIEELEDLSFLLADMEDDQRQNPISSLILDSASTSRCLQHCKQGADRLKELTDNLSTNLDAWSKFKRKRASAKVVLKKSQIDRYKAKLERAIKLLTLSHQIYTRALLRLQPDIIVTKLSQSEISGKPLPYEKLYPDHSSALRLDAAADRTITTPTATNTPIYESWNISNLFGTFSYSKNRYTIVKRNGLDPHNKKREVEEIRAEYRSPSWLINRVWTIQAVKASFGWTFCPRTYNVISFDAPVFVFARQNNVRGLQELFSEKKASPFDCGEYDITLLHHAANFRSDDVCEFLIREGVDANYLSDGNFTSLQVAMLCGKNFHEVVNVPRLLLNETEHEVSMKWYRGSKEGFLLWQQALDPLYYQKPLEERFEVAVTLAFRENGPDVLRLSLALGPLPSLVHSMVDGYGMTLLNVAARGMGKTMLSSHSPMYSDQYKMNPTEWKPLVKDLIVQGADLHLTSSGFNTPFVDLLEGLFSGEPLENTVSDFDDLGSTEHSVCNSLESRCLQLEKLPSLLNVWLKCLQESGVDLEEYGRKEMDIYQKGLVAWTWVPAFAESEPESGVWCLASLTYGPSSSDWKADVEYQPEDATESLAKMPGGWIEEDYCGRGKKLCVEEEGREIEEQDS